MNPQMARSATHLASAAVEPAAMRRIILEQSKRANVGHIGSCLCVVEILSALYGRVSADRFPDDPDRDRFILSKGHAALALYAVLALKGWTLGSEPGYILRRRWPARRSSRAQLCRASISRPDPWGMACAWRPEQRSPPACNSPAGVSIA